MVFRGLSVILADVTKSLDSLQAAANSAPRNDDGQPLSGEEPRGRPSTLEPQGEGERMGKRTRSSDTWIVRPPGKGPTPKRRASDFGVGRDNRSHAPVEKEPSPPATRRPVLLVIDGRRGRMHSPASEPPLGIRPRLALIVGGH